MGFKFFRIASDDRRGKALGESFFLFGNNKIYIIKDYRLTKYPKKLYNRNKLKEVGKDV